MQQFKQLHHQTTPLLLGNVWDVASAHCAQRAGYQAIGTSSAAIASMLGYEDGEQMPFSELLYMVRRISACNALPLTVDIEAGFSREPETIADHIQQLVELGVVGINIEDSWVAERRTLVASNDFANLLSAIVAYLKKRQLAVFINVRCDVFLLGMANALEDAVKRAQVYQQAGADGLFFPCATRVSDIQALVAATSLPVNVMAMPDLPDFAVLANLGVKRISTGNFAHEAMYSYLESQLTKIKAQGACGSLFA